MVTFQLNGKSVSSDVSEETPLLWVLREHLGLTGTKFGCGVAACGACTIHLNGAATRACITPLGAVGGASVTTIEGLSSDGSHPLQRAWVDQQVPQCGYCQSGQIMAAAALLASNPHPKRAQIIEAMTGNVCRCGTYNRIIKAIEQAAGSGRTHDA